MNKLGSYREIQNVVWPKDYSHGDLFNDIALVELASPFKWSSSAKPACLATSELVREYKGQLMVSFCFSLTRIVLWYDLVVYSESLGKLKVRVFGSPQRGSQSRTLIGYSVHRYREYRLQWAALVDCPIHIFRPYIIS